MSFQRGRPQSQGDHLSRRKEDIGRFIHVNIENVFRTIPRHCLKVRKSRNEFFLHSILQKNEPINVFESKNK